MTFINVKSAPYNATGNGTTDDFGAFVAAVAALPASGGTVYVPGNGSSNYLWKLQSGNSPSLALPDNCTILMDNDAYILNEGVACGVNGYATACFKNANQSTGNKNISIIGGRLKSASGHDGTAFVSMRKVTNFLMRDVQGLDIKGSCRFQFSFCNNVTIDNVYTGWEGSYPASFAFTDSIRIGSGTSNVNITNVILNSGDNAIAINNEPAEANGGTGADIKNVNIVNAQITTQANQGILIYQESTMSTGVISGINISNINCTPISSSDAVTIEDNSNRNGIQNVKINDATIDATSCTNAGIVVLNASSVTVSNTKIKAPGLYGIVTNNAPITVLDNISISAQRGAGDGVYFYNSDNSKLIHSEVLDSGRDNVRIDGSKNCTIIGNELTTAGEFGIYLGPSLPVIGARVIGNNIKNTTSGAMVENTGCDYVLCSLNDTHTCPIGIYTGAKGAHSVYVNNI